MTRSKKQESSRPLTQSEVIEDLLRFDARNVTRINVRGKGVVERETWTAFRKKVRGELKEKWYACQVGKNDKERETSLYRSGEFLLQLLEVGLTSETEEFSNIQSVAAAVDLVLANAKVELNEHYQSRDSGRDWPNDTFQEFLASLEELDVALKSRPKSGEELQGCFLIILQVSVKAENAAATRSMIIEKIQELPSRTLTVSTEELR